MPESIRTSVMAGWFWCAENYRHEALGLIPDEKIESEAMDVGTIFHKVLEESMGRRFPWETEFFEELQEYQDPVLGFTRKVGTTEIYCNLTGHPDDLQITPDMIVSVIENKTVGNPSKYFIERYKLPVAKFQAQIYSFILEPITWEIGGLMNRYNAIQYWHRENFKFISWYASPYYSEQTKLDILRALEAIRDPSKIIKCQEWKCRFCSEAHRKVCQFKREAQDVPKT